MQVNVFWPTGDTVNIDADTVSGSAALGVDDKTLGTVVVYNSGEVAAFIEFGDDSVTASTDASYPVAPGSTQSFGVGSSMTGGVTPLPTHIAAITASGTATVYATPGVGA